MAVLSKFSGGSIKVLPLCGWTRNIAVKDHLKFTEEKKKKLNIKPIAEQYRIDNLNETSTITNSEESKIDPKRSTTGKQRLDDLIEALDKLDKLGFKRSNGQRLFHKAYIGACLKQIYGDDLYRDLAELLREYELDELRTDVIVTTPRRFGKTFGTALFVAAFLCTQPGMEVAIYSTGRRASRKMLALIYKIVVRLMGSESCIQSFNEEKLSVKGFRGAVSTCFSYPSKVQISHIFLFIYFSFKKLHLIESYFFFRKKKDFFFWSSTQQQQHNPPHFYFIKKILFSSFLYLNWKKKTF